LKHASAQDRASIQIGSTGGPGFGELHAAISALLSKDQQSDKIGAALSDYLAKFCEKNAVATQFDVRSMADFGFDENGLDPWTDLQEKFLRLLVSEYRVTTEALDLNQSIDEGTSPLAKLLPPFVLEDMKNEIPRLLKYQADLASMHHDVKANSGNSLPPGLPASKMRSSALEGLRIRPTIKFQAPGLTTSQLRVVLNAPPSERLEVASRFNPNVGRFGVIWGTDGDFLFTTQICFVNDQGQEVVSQEEPDDGSHGYIWWQPDGRGTEDNVRDWATSIEGAHAGVYGVKVKNKAEMVFHLGFMELNWSATGGRLDYFLYKMISSRSAAGTMIKRALPGAVSASCPRPKTMSAG
jgi:hypothetical protein